MYIILQLNILYSFISHNNKYLKLYYFHHSYYIIIFNIYSYIIIIINNFIKYKN